MDNVAIKKSINDHIIRSSPSQIIEKIRVLKNFAKFTKKHPCQSLALNKVGSYKIPKKAPVALSRI